MGAELVSAEFRRASGHAVEGRQGSLTKARRREDQMRHRTIVGGAVLLIAGLLAAGAGVFAAPRGIASAGVDPSKFTSPKANPYFPLTPGKVFVYRGSEGQQRLVEHLRVTHKTQQIAGVKTIVISDILFSNGHLAEKTTDW